MNEIFVDCFVQLFYIIYLFDKIINIKYENVFISENIKVDYIGIKFKIML